MTKKYRYENGEEARILCTDGFDRAYPIVSMTPDGQSLLHHISGESLNPDNRDYDLVEVTQYEYKDGDRVMVWDDPEYKQRRIFSHADRNGDPRVYIEGMTKWTSSNKTTPWPHCELAEDEE